MNLPQVRAALARNPAQMFIQRQIMQRSPAGTFKAGPAGQGAAAVNAAGLTQQQKIALNQAAAAAAAGKGGMPQLIVSGGSNANAVQPGQAGQVQKVQQAATGVTVHQFQQIVKQGSQSVQQISGPIPHAVLAAKQAGAGGAQQAVQARVI